ncbi:hypothetical protein ACHAXA_005323 [Cyclostephanos tholiformis]|uniref:Diacylglycerol O-acyltransferase n=1 Tax=Cyclostephanos tholiformis TaxID=382380 RepID=A0ABD3RAX1_9STRA
MSHVSATILSATPSIEALSSAIDAAMSTHPLLRSVIVGTGEPERRIDLFQMVREGDPDPCSFVVNESLDVGDVLRIVDVDGSDERALERSWREQFANDIDDGSWYERSVRGGEPLWRLTLHRLGTIGGESSPCALIFHSNHCISDQTSVNMLMDQLLNDVDSIERGDGSGRAVLNNVAVPQDMPMSVEDSVLGIGGRYSEIGAGGLSTGTLAYVAGTWIRKALEGLRNPVILPDSSASPGRDGVGIAGAISTIMGRSAGGESESASERRTLLQFRDLPVEVTSSLLGACRANGVSVTNALTAAMVLTSSDFVDGGIARKGGEKARNYKVLQSLDMRRFGARLDECDTVACMAGSNDLMHGPVPDRSGEFVRSDPKSGDSQKLFWDLARDGRDQTKRFIESDGPVNAVRVFDFAMTIR